MQLFSINNQLITIILQHQSINWNYFLLQSINCSQFIAIKLQANDFSQPLGVSFRSFITAFTTDMKINLTVSNESNWIVLFPQVTELGNCQHPLRWCCRCMNICPSSGSKEGVEGFQPSPSTRASISYYWEIMPILESQEQKWIRMLH